MARWYNLLPLVHPRRFRLDGLRLANWCWPMILICRAAMRDLSLTEHHGRLRIWVVAMELSLANFKLNAN